MFCHGVARSRTEALCSWASLAQPGEIRSRGTGFSREEASTSDPSFAAEILSSRLKPVPPGVCGPVELPSPKRQRWPLNIERRPPEHPAQHPNALLLDLFGGEQFVGVFGAVVAAQSQPVAG